MVGDLVAALYGPSDIDTDKVMIEEITQYPFKDTISFLFHPKTREKMGFSFRIPLWCRNASVTINGEPVELEGDNTKYHKICRRFHEGDRLDIVLDMPVRVTYPNSQGISFEKGPIAARRINWPLEEGKFTPVMPKWGVEELTTDWEIIDLIPYGCTQLRLTVFPIIPPSNIPVQEF